MSNEHIRNEQMEVLPYLLGEKFIKTVFIHIFFKTILGYLSLPTISFAFVLLKVCEKFGIFIWLFKTK
jgi:hypothetical protein